jgi:serine/threonine-protein kinase
MKQPLYSPGTIIAGKYKIERAIARGGCSIVYRGLHQDMGRHVALKLMAAQDGTDMSAWVERFRREARLASQLRHRNTITTFDYGAEGELLYIAMEWVDGDSLRNVIKKEGAMEAMRVAKLSAQMLRSLSEAHGLGILHRDLKPSNIMLTTDAEGVEILKVLDFGLAKAQLDPQTQTQLMKLTQDGDFVGTPRYASPEQLKGRELTAASDIYGVGMVMWEMLTGQPAVPDIDFGTCVQYHLGPQPWELPAEIKCPRGLANIVECALAKKAEDRFQSCEDMLAALEAWIADPNGVAATSVDRAKSDASPSPMYTLPPVHELFGEMSDLSAPSLPKNASISSEFDRSPRPVQPTPSEAPPAISRESRHADDAFEEALAAPRPVQPAAQHAEPLAVVPLYEPLELDRRPAQPRTQPASRGPAAVAPHLAPTEASRPQDAHRNRRVALIALIALGLVLAAALIISRRPHQTRGAPGELDPKASAPPAAESTAPPQAANRETPTSEVLLVAIKRAGWSVVGAPDSTELGDLRQTTARVARDGQFADLTVYECDELSTAYQLMGSTEPPVRAVRLGRTVIRIADVEGKPGGAVSSLQQYMYKIRDIYEKGAAGSVEPSDISPPPTP